MTIAAPAAIIGTYSDLKFIKTRSVAVVSVEIPIENANAFVAAFGTPMPGAEVHVAIARLNGSPEARTVASGPAARPARTDKRDWSDVPSAEQAGIRCAEMRFWRFLEERHGAKIGSADECALALRLILGIASRRDIAGNPAAFRAWEALDAEYNSWCFEQGREVR